MGNISISLGPSLEIIIHNLYQEVLYFQVVILGGACFLLLSDESPYVSSSFPKKEEFRNVFLEDFLKSIS